MQRNKKTIPSPEREVKRFNGPLVDLHPCHSSVLRSGIKTWRKCNGLSEAFSWELSDGKFDRQNLRRSRGRSLGEHGRENQGLST
jgi:hypothetical protein